MEDASALYAAQRFAARSNTARDAIRLDGADHERVTITALLRSTWEGRHSALRDGGEAGLLLSVPSTQVLSADIPLQKRPTNRSFAPKIHFRLAADRIFQGDRRHDAGGQRGAAFYCAAGYQRGLSGTSEKAGEGTRDRVAFPFGTEG